MRKISAYAKLLRVLGIGTFASVFGFLNNDSIDVELDRFADDFQKKPLVSGEAGKKNVSVISFFLAFSTFFFVALLWYNQTIDYYRFMALICIILAGFLGTIYDEFGKNIAGSNFLVAISVSLIFLFGALSFHQPNLITWIIFILTFENILYMKGVQNGIKDSEHDYKLGVKNIARSLERKVEENSIVISRSFQAFDFGMRLFSAVIFSFPFVLLGYRYSLWQIILLVLLIVTYFYFDIKLFSIKTFNSKKNQTDQYNSNIFTLFACSSYAFFNYWNTSILSFNTNANSMVYCVHTLLGEKLFKPGK